MEDRRDVVIFMEGLSFVQCKLLGYNLEAFSAELRVTLVSVLPPLPPRFYQLPKVVEQDAMRAHQARLNLAGVQAVFPFPVACLLLRKTFLQAVRHCIQRGLHQLLVAESLLPRKRYGEVGLMSVDAWLASPVFASISQCNVHANTSMANEAKRLFLQSNPLGFDRAEVV